MAITVNIDSPPRISQSFPQVAHGFSVGEVVYRRDTNVWQKARASTSSSGRALGVVTAVADVDNFTLTMQGYITTGVPVATAGTVFYVDPLTAGAITSTQNLHYSIPVLVVVESGTSAIVLLGIDTQRIRQWMTGDICSTIPASPAVRYALPWGSTGVPQATESIRSAVAMIGTYQHYTINTAAAQPATGALVITVRVASVDTALAITIAAGSAAGVYENIADIITVPSVSLMSVRYTNSASSVTGTIVSTNMFYEAN